MRGGLLGALVIRPADRRAPADVDRVAVAHTYRGTRTLDGLEGDVQVKARRGDVVVVTVNQRLNIFGHLDLSALGGDAHSGNAGTLDMVASLEWVRDNIAAFGGDPARVTLFGQSAGGSSTASIAQDLRHAGLLHRAIVQSGSLHGAPGFPEAETAAAYAEALAKRLDTAVPGLRDVPAVALHRAELALARDPAMARSLGRPPVLPVLDGTVLRVAEGIALPTLRRLLSALRG